MAHQVKVASEKADQAIQINTHPDTCPVCLHGIDSRFKTGYVFSDVKAELLYQCPRQDCRELLIAYYAALLNQAGKASEEYRLKKSVPHTFGFLSLHLNLDIELLCD